MLKIAKCKKIPLKKVDKAKEMEYNKAVKTSSVVIGLTESPFFGCETDIPRRKAKPLCVFIKTV